MPGRRPAPKPSRLGGLMSALPFGGGATKSGARGKGSSGRGRKGAGIALATAAAGFALTNRDKLSSMMGRGRDHGTGDGTPPAGGRLGAP
jgi:hypothetical protein